MTVNDIRGQAAGPQATQSALRPRRAGQAAVHWFTRVPTALTEARKQQAAEYRNADGTERLVRHDGRDMPFGSTTHRKLPAGSFDGELRRMRNGRDAGNAVLVADNANLHTLTYCWGTHKAMEAWLSQVPKNGQLVVNLICTPSTHAGSTDAQKAENFEKFAKTNVYNLEVLFPDGTSQKMKFDTDGNSPPKGPSSRSQYATPSPNVVIDLQKWAGQDIRIRGWADGSAGVEGYKEHRETILHL